MELRVGVVLNKMGTRNYLTSYATQFGMSKGLACIVVNKFCDGVLKVSVCDLVFSMLLPTCSLIFATKSWSRSSSHDHWQGCFIQSIRSFCQS